MWFPDINWWSVLLFQRLVEAVQDPFGHIESLYSLTLAPAQIRDVIDVSERERESSGLQFHLRIEVMMEKQLHRDRAVGRAL